jgi:hypothetical protein
LSGLSPQFKQSPSNKINHEPRKGILCDEKFV